MQTFSMFFSEDAGEKFSKMSDEQFADWKKKNPGASSKADELRKKATSAMKSSAPDPKGKGGALAKAGTSGGYKKVLANKAKQLAADAAKKAGGALVKKGKETIADKIRKKDMGKWSQGIKNAPNKQKAASGSAGEPELEGQKAKDTKAREEAGKYRMSKDDITGALRDYDAEKEAAKKKKEEEEKKKKGGFMAGLKKSMGGDLISKDDETRKAARNELGQKIGRGLRSTVTNNVKDAGVSYGSQQSGLRQR